MASGKPYQPQQDTSIRRHMKIETLVAGVSGGVVSSFALHPLDLIKVRFQVDEGPSKAGTVVRPKYRGIWHAAQTIVATDGWKGLYRGVTPNVVGAGMSWGLFFFIYNTSKSWMQDGDPTVDLGMLTNGINTTFAGLATLCLSNPIWVSKTRMCLHYGTPGQTIQYVGMWGTLANIYRFEGVRGLYKGFVPGMFGTGHGAIQFMAYERIKKFYCEYHNKPMDARLGTFQYITASAVSKIIAVTTTYPYQVVRSRLQDQHRHYNGATDVIRQIWRQEGMRGFYKGLSASMVHVLPNIVIVFLVYEWVIGACVLRSWEQDLSTSSRPDL